MRRVRPLDLSLDAYVARKQPSSRIGRSGMRTFERVTIRRIGGVRVEFNIANWYRLYGLTKCTLVSTASILHAPVFFTKIMFYVDSVSSSIRTLHRCACARTLLCIASSAPSCATRDAMTCGPGFPSHPVTHPTRPSPRIPTRTTDLSVADELVSADGERYVYVARR